MAVTADLTASYHIFSSLLTMHLGLIDLPKPAAAMNRDPPDKLCHALSLHALPQLASS